MNKTQRKTKEKWHKTLSFVVASAICLSLFGAVVALPSPVFAQQSGSTLGVTRLETKLIESNVKAIGGTLIEDNPANPYTVIEATFLVKARAFGGDIFLPTYREDVVFSAHVLEPKEGSNAIVAIQPSIELSRTLPQFNGKYLLKEYEEVDMKIKVGFKIIPKSMSSRLVFEPTLDTLLWYPAIKSGGNEYVGIDPEIGARLAQIPLASTAYSRQEVAELDFKADQVVLLKSNKTYTTLKENVRQNGFANIIGIFRSIFSR